jgi:hypothetical protein
MVLPESPPGFIVRTVARKAASDNDFRIGRDARGAWRGFALTTAHWSEIGNSGARPRRGATRIFASMSERHAALDRADRLSLSFPKLPPVPG